MSRVLLLVGFLGFTLLSTGCTGDERSNAIDTKLVALEDELRILKKDRGPTHPLVVALQERIDLLKADAVQGEPILPNGLLVVISKQNVAATLKDARIRSLGGRSFVVGLEVKAPNFTKGTYVGMVVWIPVNDVIQMVEVSKAPGFGGGGGSKEFTEEDFKKISKDMPEAKVIEVLGTPKDSMQAMGTRRHFWESKGNYYSISFQAGKVVEPLAHSSKADYELMKGLMKAAKKLEKKNQ